MWRVILTLFNIYLVIVISDDEDAPQFTTSAGASTSWGESPTTLMPYRGRGLCPYSSTSGSSDDDGPDTNSLMDERTNLLGSGLEDSAGTPPMKEEPFVLPSSQEDSPIKRKRPQRRPRKPTISSDSDSEELEVSQCFCCI